MSYCVFVYMSKGDNWQKITLPPDGIRSLTSEYWAIY